MQCSNSGSVDTTGKDHASDSEDSELGSYSRAKRSVSATSSIAAAKQSSSKIRSGDVPAQMPQAASPRAQTRSRDADVKNRLSGSRANRISNGATSSGGGSKEDIDATPVEVKARSKAKAVPDFPAGFNTSKTSNNVAEHIEGT